MNCSARETTRGGGELIRVRTPPRQSQRPPPRSFGLGALLALPRETEVNLGSCYAQPGTAVVPKPAVAPWATRMQPGRGPRRSASNQDFSGQPLKAFRV